MIYECDQEKYRIECFERWKRDRKKERGFDLVSGLNESLRLEKERWERDFRDRLKLNEKALRKPVKPRKKINFLDGLDVLESKPSLKKGRAATLPR